MNWLLNLMGYNTAPSPYTQADWMGASPKAQPKRPAQNMMKLAGMTDAEIRSIEKRKTLPKNLQLQILDRTQ